MTRGLAALALLLALAGCSSDRDVWTVKGDPQRVVVFFHGAGASGDPMTGPPAALMRRMHAQGWTIVGATAGGDAWGDPASVADYRKVIPKARTVVGVAESMGALPAVQLLRDRVLDRVMLVSPVLNLRAMLSTPFAPSIRSAWRGDPPASASPVTWRSPPAVTVAADPTDPVVTTSANAGLYARHAHVKVRTCTGGHVSADCFAKVSS